jgi:two-component system sensor histidine kinase/response regulator
MHERTPNSSPAPEAQAPRPSARLLIVDDEVAQMEALRDTLSDRGFEVSGHTSPMDALEALKERDFDILLTDLMMPGIDGISLLRSALETRPLLVGVLMTGHGTIDTAVEAMKVGAHDYILKPFKLSAVLPVLARALAVRDLRMENAELQRRVQERTRELELANADLEAFSFSVSHDLLAPLRAVRGFSEIVETDFGPQLPPEGQRLLSRVTKSAQRMEALVRDLLEFSRFGRQTLEKRPVDMARLAQSVVDELRMDQPERQIDVRIGGLPEGWADPSLLRQVFVNLLSNGFKFTRNVASAAIEVGGEKAGGECVYFVRDNGAGFDMQYVGKLFGVFQRLHRESEFEGTGVGLSTVQRIIERHGGRIWAESEVGKGATFRFSLPSP